MLDKSQKEYLRSRIFRHLDGLVTAPAAYSLYHHGVTEYFLIHKMGEVNDLAAKFKANPGYLNTALHTLACQGWLIHKVSQDGHQTQYSITERGIEAFSKFEMYKGVTYLLKITEHFHPRKFDPAAFQYLDRLMNSYFEYYSDNTFDQESVEFQIQAHIEACIISPSIVLLAMNGMFHKYFMNSSFMPEEYHLFPVEFEKILDFLRYLGWFEKSNGTFKFTDVGVFYAKRASAYGVTVSYLPTLRKLDDLIFGNPNVLWELATAEKEAHVDREMNVWGSGGAHGSYFTAVDEILIEIFNQKIEDQPLGILDMGCGNAAFLIHAFDIIYHRTARGKMLDEYPLFLIGADFNAESLKVSRANAIAADVWAKFVHGDIGRPEELAERIEKDYNIRLSDLLSFRSFIDHNRLWNEPIQTLDSQIGISQGCYAYKGKKINNKYVEASLYEHLSKWKPFIYKHGLLVIELHTIPPELAAKNIGKTAVTAYNATHGYSDQYIIELRHFQEVAKLLNLKSDLRYERTYPDSELATVSIQLLKT